MILSALRLTKRHPSATLKCNELFLFTLLWGQSNKIDHDYSLNKYSPLAGSSTCTVCFAGSYAAIGNLIDISAIVLSQVPLWMIDIYIGAVDCTPCKSGTFSTRGFPPRVLLQRATSLDLYSRASHISPLIITFFNAHFEDFLVVSVYIQV
jgi:hypothetical protein